MSNYTPAHGISSVEVKFLIVIASVESIVGSLANLVIIIMFITREELRRKNSDLLILNLAVADFISLTTFLPWNTYLTSQGKGENRAYYTSLNTFCLLYSGTAVLTIAFDKYIAVVYPLRYSTFISRRRTIFMISFTWLIAIGLVIYHFFNALFSGKHHILDKSLSGVVLLQLLFVSALYVVVFKAVRKQLLLHSVEKILIKSAFNTFILIFLFYSTFLPYAVLQMSSMNDFFVWRRLFSLIYINACINPFVYFFRMKRFRRAFQKFCRNISKRNRVLSLSRHLR